MRLGLVLSFVMALAPAARAQSTAPKVIEQDPIIGVRQAREWLGNSEIRQSCPRFVLADPGPQDIGHEGTALRSWCGVDTSYALPDADGARWLTVIYSRHGEYPADPARRNRRVTLDTVRLITSVLYARRDQAPEWNAEWVGTVAALYVRSIDVDVVSRPDRSLLAAVRYCFNGTGGCWQHFMRRSGARWTAVVEDYERSFPRLSDGRIGKGGGIDLRTMSGEFGIYSNADPNCCPSRHLTFILEQRGDSLLLRSHQVTRAP